jgi:CheY-like chemotaxis protein
MRAFIIDDDHLSIFITKSLLDYDSEQWEVCCFEDAAEALQQLQTAIKLPDVIFLDLNMPVISGWDFLDTLAASPTLQERCNIYILTSSLDLADTARAKEYAVVQGFIHKPITAEDIKLVVEAFVEKKQFLIKLLPD